MGETGEAQSSIPHQEAPRPSSPPEVYRTEPFNLDSFKSRATEIGYANEHALINSARAMENLLGAGGNGNVYKIPKIDGYVFKVPHGTWGADPSVITPLETVEDPLPTINLGQAVARAGNNYVLKEQLGVPAGVPYGEMRSRNEEEGKVVYEHYLALAAGMPQSAYDSLAELFEFLNEHRLGFDPSKANNILVDREGGRFNVVDLNPLQEGQEPSNNFAYMTIALMDNAYAWRVKDPELEVELTKRRKEILTKAYEACKKAELPLPSEHDSSLEYSFTLAGLEGQWVEHRQRLAEEINQ